MARVNKLNLNGTDYAIGTEYFGYCTTGSTSNIKAVTTLNTTGFELTNGTILHVVFQTNHTSGSLMQLNVNNKGARNVMNKANKNVYYLPRGYYSFVYYNNLWYMNGKGYEDLEITGTGNAITNIDAKDWTNGIKATKSFVEAYHSTPLSQVSTGIDIAQLTGSGSLAHFWQGNNGDTIEISLATGTLDFGQIPTATTSKNRRFHIYIMEGEFKLLGCWTNESNGAVLASRCPALLKCWLGKKTASIYQWMVEVTYFSYAF